MAHTYTSKDHQLSCNVSDCYEGAESPLFCPKLESPKGILTSRPQANMSEFNFKPTASKPFRDSAPSAETVMMRTYSRRKPDGTRENFEEAMLRTVNDIAEIGKLTQDEYALIREQALAQHSFPSGRAFWVAGTEWGKKPENFSGYYNCTSTHMTDTAAFGLLVDLAMQGSGTGAVLEQEVVDQLPPISRRLEIKRVSDVGQVVPGREDTKCLWDDRDLFIMVGDSRKGWRDAYMALIHEATRKSDGVTNVYVLLDNVRPSGEKLKGFGGTANPVKLGQMFHKVADILNGAVGRKLSTVEACLLIDEAATCIVAGNIRRCLPGHALVSTTDGLVRMDEIKVGTKVETPYGVKSVTDKFIQGEQSVVRVLTNGPDMLATANHEVAIMGDSPEEIKWTTVGQLKPGDRLLHTNQHIPTTVLGFGESEVLPTYDITVEDAHCFYADGFLTHNSAGMRQFSQDDQEAATAKLGLYSQDEDGNWRVDPKKEALRMANHTRCYHTKPSYQEIEDAVRLQFNSGEGAIQYVPEAVARANADLLVDRFARNRFLDAYTSAGREAAKRQLLMEAKALGVELDDRELAHRMDRYGLNPCFAPGTIVMTRDGYQPIEALVGKIVEIHDGNEWRTIDNFRVTANDQDVYDLELHDGTIITATEYHKFILADGRRVELKDLKEGDELMAAKVEPVKGTIQAKGAYLKGFLIGDGTSDKGHGAMCKVYAPKKVCLGRLEASQKELGMVYERRANGHDVGETGLTPSGYLKGLSATSEDLNPWCYAHKHEFPYEVLNWTDEAKYEFIAGLFDADGTSMDTSNGFAYQITSISRPFLQGLVTLLRTLGIASKIGPVRAGGLKDFGAERGGVYKVKPTYRLAIAQAGSIKLAQGCTFERLEDFSDRVTAYSVKSRANRVKSITFSHNAPEVFCCTVEGTHAFTLGTVVLVAQCGEIIGRDFHCNLAEVHLNTIDPSDYGALRDAFYAAGLQVASLLQHEFVHERYQYSREIDPIVGVSFTGLWDFFVHAFGYDWLRWMMQGRPAGRARDMYEAMERDYLGRFRRAAHEGVKAYCDKHGKRLPNRITTVQPAGTKSLLTGASSGWHPPKAQRFIRRITLGVQDPLVPALIEYGYKVIPAQSARDEHGKLLDDIADPRVHEVLVEIPTEVSWANLPGCDEFDLAQLPVEAQWGLYINVQRHYVDHNASATIELREHEIPTLSKLIYDNIQADGGYISAALLARFDANETFPRLPMQPISKEEYERQLLPRKVVEMTDDRSLLDILNKYDSEEWSIESVAGCSNASCIAKADADEREGKA